MILLDTHVWVWLVDENPKLTKKHLSHIQNSKIDEIGVSMISCWEVAKLVEYNRLELSCSVDFWLNEAITYPKINLINLNPEIIVKSTQLPGEFHKDPADQLIVATAMHYNCELLTADSKIINYTHVKTS